MPDAGIPGPSEPPLDEVLTAPAAFELGLAARRAGRRDTAVAWFERTLELDPDDRAARLELATVLREQRRVDAAEPHYRRLLKGNPKFWPALAGLGLCSRIRRDLPASAGHLAEAFAIVPADRAVRHEYATTLREMHRVDEAEPLYRAALADDARSWPALVGLGLCARIRRDLPAAAEHLAAALAIAPRERGIRLEYATTLRELRRLDEADAAYLAMLADDPAAWQALLGLGLCARARRDLPTAAGHLAAALAIAPRERSLRLEHATTLREMRRLDEAEAAYRGMLADDPAAWQALLGLGLCARVRRDLPASAEHLAAALAIAPRERSLRLEHATTLREMRRLDEAEAAYRAILADAPGFWLAELGLGLCARMRGDRDAALAHLAAAAALAPDTEAPAFELAAEHRDAGRFEEARAILRAWTERGTAGAQAWLGLGYVERQASDRAAALEMFRQGFAHYPQRAQFLIELAVEERALGHFEEAERWLRRAAEADDVATSALQNLADMARAAQHQDEALELFRQAAARPDATLAIPLAIAQLLSDLGRREEAFAALDDAAQRYGAMPDIALKRCHLLRRAGFRQEALDLIRQAVAAAPGHFPLWQEWYETERFSGDFEHIDRCLDAAPAGNVPERAMLWNLRGQVAAQRWRFDEAAACFREALALNPQLSGVHQALALASLLRFDIPTTREHLQVMKQQRAALQQLQGLSPHLAHTHIGNFFDEFVIDAQQLAALTQAQTLAPEARVGRLLGLVRAAPGHTASAVALMLALRQAGRLNGPWRGPEGAAIPPRIAQFWDEPDPPPDVAALMQTWQERNPGFAWRRFDLASGREFLRRHCPPAVLRAFQRAHEPAMKADVLRLAWLYVEGGCYADADDRCLRPVDELFPPGGSFIGFQEEYGTLGNNFLAAAPQHPVIGLALEQAVEAINRGDDDMMWLATGPGLITRAFAQTLATSPLLPSLWVERSRILDRHELERVVATHCAAGYKNSKKHWLRATFGQPRPAPRAAD